MDDPISPNLQTARIICGALMLGVVVLWAIAFVMTSDQIGLNSSLDVDPPVLLAVVIAVALGSVAGALFFRSRALPTVDDATPRDSSTSPRDASNTQSNLIIAWALLEGQALIAGVFFMLTGAANLLIISALVFVIGFALTFPRAEWFAQAHATWQT